MEENTSRPLWSGHDSRGWEKKEGGGFHLSGPATHNQQSFKTGNATFWEESKNFFLEMMISPISV
jgi:hypothetical protein